MKTPQRANAVRKAFSRAAQRYDWHSGVQRSVSESIIGKLGDFSPSGRLLDVGMGTGYLTDRICRRFPGASVTALDFASGMVRWARGHYDTFHIVQADARRLPFKEHSFDAVVSNSVYQWVDDLPAAFVEVYRVLAPGGAFHLSCFAEGSFPELTRALRHAAGPDQGCGFMTGTPLAGKAQIRAALVRSGFTAASSRVQRIETVYPDMTALLGWLKNIGAGGVRRECFISRGLLKKASEYYDAHFRLDGNVRASFRVVHAGGRRE